MYINSLMLHGNIHCDSLHYYFDTMIFSKYHESAVSSGKILPQHIALQIINFISVNKPK